MADGGYPKAWRDFIETGTPINSEMLRKRLLGDMAEMDKRLVLSPSAREVIVGASDKIRTYFGSSSETKPRGDAVLRDRAMLALEAMETSLFHAKEKHVVP